MFSRYARIRIGIWIWFALVPLLAHCSSGGSGGEKATPKPTVLTPTSVATTPTANAPKPAASVAGTYTCGPADGPWLDATVTSRRSTYVVVQVIVGDRLIAASPITAVQAG